MKTQSLLTIVALAASIQAWTNDTVWTTVTTDIFTTVCPSATTFVQNSVTYTATASETITITNCPCTVSASAKPSIPAPIVSKPTSNATIVPPVWITTTETVSAYTTYCPAPTIVTEGNKTYSVTEATTLTISQCPCTRTSTLPGSISTSTISLLTTYCPSSTTLILSGTTYPVPTAGTITIPIYTTTAVPVTTPTAPLASGTTASQPGVPESVSPAASAPLSVPTTVSAPPAPTVPGQAPPATTPAASVGETKTSSLPTATTSLPLQVSVAAGTMFDVKLGVMAAAGFAAALI